MNHKLIVSTSREDFPRFDCVDVGTIYKLPHGNSDNIYMRTEGGAVNLRTGSFYKPEPNTMVIPFKKGCVLTLSIGGGC